MSFQMLSRISLTFRAALVLGLICQTPLLSRHAQAHQDAGNDLRKAASWHWPTTNDFQDHLSSFLDQRQATQEQRAGVMRVWSSGANLTGPAFLEHVLDTCSLLEPRLADLTSQIRSLKSSAVALKDYPWLTSDLPGWLQDAVRLACGRAYAQRKMYDEALETLSGLELKQVCDPASLLFYRASAEHHLLKKNECLANLQLLLQRQDELPARYRQLAQLMQADIKPLEPDSLDEIARMMTDVQRRLDLGRAGQTVRDEEDSIVKKLDKLIEQVEQQAQQMQQQQAGGGQGQQGQNAQQPAGQPMDDSRIAGTSGPGDVDQKQLDDRSAWGNLPPAQRQEALQRLTEELPTHYRDVIEGYFRQLAKDRSR
jgi:hypothetical protein